MLQPEDVSSEVYWFQQLVHRRRIEKGWDERELARRVGNSTALVANLEAGRTAGSVQTLIRFTKALGIDTGDLFKEAPSN
ncbi:helix-turn-helix transcriptional regulator [Glycomyces sp. NPDC046736]|uniref:helix-turn-helix domain-containing protein n=1 Tax=Glycomyces sp. NPDC046736 TaxID=3155615 RepID=UPI0033F258EB